MSRLLLFFWCATIFVSGSQGKDEGNSSALSSTILPEKITEQPIGINSTPTKVQSVSSIIGSVHVVNKNVTNSHEEHSSLLPETDDQTTKAEMSVTGKPISVIKLITSTATLASTVSTSSIRSIDTSNISSTETHISSTVPPATISVPSPSTGKWIVNDTGIVCVVIQMAIQFNISYINKNQTEVFKIFDMPANDETMATQGNCGKLEQCLTVQWPSSNTTSDSLTLHFTKNETEKHYVLHHLEVIFQTADFPNANLSGPLFLIHASPIFSTELSNSYRCMKQQILPLEHNTTNEITGWLSISDLQFEAFRTDNSTTFSLAKDCAFDTPDVVPIAIGCALAGLVVIVLIAYLVGRRRSQIHGYLSM